MPNGASTIELGAKREMVCAWCTNLKRKTQSCQHVYGQHRVRGKIDFFWECLACGHLRSMSVWDDVPEARDPATERLHAQWREDNREFRLTPEQPDR
jgi:hypothetical protein